jgi:hypothetical protein
MNLVTIIVSDGYLVTYIGYLMNRYLFAINLALVSFTATVNAADVSIKPGLWEVTTTSDLLNFASQISTDQMDGLNALAKEYGFDVPEIKNGAAKSSTCITPEMAKQKILPGAVQNQAGCTVKKVTQNGNYYHMAFTCVNPELNGNGTAEGSFTNAETFTGVTNFSGTIQNVTVNEQANVNGKWLASSCANAEPAK